MEQVEKIIKNIQSYLHSQMKMTWSSYDSAEEFQQYIQHVLLRVQQKDKTVIKELQALFAPTGDLQEIAIDNGWGDEFLQFSKQFDIATH